MKKKKFCLEQQHMYKQNITLQQTNKYIYINNANMKSKKKKHAKPILIQCKM